MGASVSLMLMWLFFFFLALFPAIYTLTKGRDKK